MKLRALVASEWPAYDELARQHGTLFHRLDWLALFGPRIQAYGLFDEGENLVGGLALHHARRWGLDVVRSAPFTPTCGPFLAVKSQHPVAVLEERRKALDCLVQFLRARRPALCMLPLDQRITDALPFFWDRYKVIPHYTYLLDLTPAPEQLLRNLSAERRKNISKAQRDGLQVRQTTDMRVVLELVLATFARQQKSLDRAGLEGILFRYANPENSFAFVTYRDDQPIAACFVVHGGTTAYYLLGGYRAEERHHGAGAAAMFAAIRHAQALGLKTFDFEGSVIPEIERYFRGFGGQLTPYLTVNKAALPLEIVLKFFKRRIF